MRYVVEPIDMQGTREKRVKSLRVHRFKSFLLVLTFHPHTNGLTDLFQSEHLKKCLKTSGVQLLSLFAGVQLLSLFGVACTQNLDFNRLSIVLIIHCFCT